ncbi:S-layer homology domain-containing protein [Paenalkalicoccus suaedae]|uniref:S-layer homology domain-containing protein n=1 Tax=Paenalkalicoccus suaedae TaxID=2592382 RepID=A0A859FHL0_9BACI|nr:S-layer homology domain-containing protein [Paenalkalicoccus suaedae]QKS72599.1 S-layer homology domain-containing protein [Paenalkalicoccus suaedae]
MNTSQSYKKYLVALVSASLVAPGTVYAQEAAFPVFSDMEIEGEGLDVINKLVSTGIINGFPDNTFRPNASISREHAALMMYRALKLEGAKDVVGTLSVFDDVDPYHRSAVEIAAVVEAGIFKGYNGKLNMNDVISRQEMASVIVRTFGLTLDGKPVDFTDEETIHVSHKKAVKILQSQGVLLGVPVGAGLRFGAREELTRLSFALMLSRSIDRVEELLEDEEEIGEEELPEVEVPVDEEEEQGEEVEEETEEKEQVVQPVPVVPVVPEPGGGTPIVNEAKEKEAWSKGNITFKVMDDDAGYYSQGSFVYLDKNGEFKGFGYGDHPDYLDGKVQYKNLEYVQDVQSIQYYVFTGTTMYEGIIKVEDFKKGASIELTKEDKEYTEITLSAPGEVSEENFIIEKMYFNEDDMRWRPVTHWMHHTNVYNVPLGDYSIIYSGRTNDNYFYTRFDSEEFIGYSHFKKDIDLEKMKVFDIGFDRINDSFDLDWNMVDVSFNFDRYSEIPHYVHSNIFISYNYNPRFSLFLDEDAYITYIRLEAENELESERLMVYYDLDPSLYSQNISLSNIYELRYKTPSEIINITRSTNISELLNLKVTDSYGNYAHYFPHNINGGSELLINYTFKTSEGTYKDYRSLVQLDWMDIYVLPEDFKGEVTLDITFEGLDIIKAPDQTFVFNVVSEEEFLELPSARAEAEGIEGIVSEEIEVGDEFYN